MSYYYEKLTGKVAKHLARFPYYATAKILNLMQFQDSNQQFLISDKHLYDYFEEQKHQLSTDEKLSILFSLFKGRIDVYAKSYIDENGKINYFPSYNYGWKKLPVEKRTCQPLTKQVLLAHLRGEISIGIFPMSLSDTCSFWAIDFDKNNWREEVSILRDTAEQHGFEGISKSLVRAMVLISGFSSRKKLLVSRREMLEKDCWNWLCRSQKIFAFLHLTVCFQIKIFCPREDLAILSHCPYKGKLSRREEPFLLINIFSPFLNNGPIFNRFKRLDRRKF